MKKQTNVSKSSAYHTLDEWLPALQQLPGFSLLAVEFKKQTLGYVKQVKGTVTQEYDKFFGGFKIKQSVQITVIWRHTGACYKSNRRDRMEEFDVTKYLEQ